MRETADDLARLQRLLDDTYARAGDHLASIHTDAARISAAAVIERLDRMQVFVVATVSSDGRPFTGPIDAFFYRGRVHFGTAAQSLRARHLRRSDTVSATHVRGEELVVTVHGRARPYDLGADTGFVEVLRDYYGGEWADWGSGSPYYRIEPDRMVAADMSVYQQDQTVSQTVQPA